MSEAVAFRDHFWLPADKPGVAWSRTDNAYVPITDPRIAASPISQVTAIASEAELDAVMRHLGLASPVISALDVRVEASRRMQALVGARDADHLTVIISNGVREQGRLQAVRVGIPGLAEPRAWTEDEAARAAALWNFDRAIEAIRAASNAMEPAPPADYRDDARWQTAGEP